MRVTNTHPLGGAIFVGLLGRVVEPGETVTVTKTQGAELLAQVCAVTGARNWTPAAESSSSSSSDAKEVPA